MDTHTCGHTHGHTHTYIRACEIQYTFSPDRVVPVSRRTPPRHPRPPSDVHSGLVSIYRTVESLCNFSSPFVTIRFVTIRSVVEGCQSDVFE